MTKFNRQVKTNRSKSNRGSAKGRSRSSRSNVEPSLYRQETKYFKVGEIEFPHLIPDKIIAYLDNTEQILRVNELWPYVDPETFRVPTPEAVPLPLVGNTNEQKLQLSIQAAQNAISKIEKEQHKTAYALQLQSIPTVFRMKWSKGITSARELRKKIMDMCAYKKDNLLKIHHFKRFQELKLHSYSSLDLRNYENAFVEIVEDYIESGGGMTMDEQIRKLEEDIYSVKSNDDSYIREIVETHLHDGPDIATHPTTRGWTFEGIMQVIKNRNYAQTGPDHHQKINSYSQDNSSKKRNHEERRTPFKASTSYSKAKKNSYDKRSDYNQKDRVQLRERFTSGKYGNRENPKKAHFNFLSKRNSNMYKNRTNTVEANFTKRKFPPSKNTKYINNNDSKTMYSSNQPSSNNNHYGPGNNTNPNSNTKEEYPKSILKKKPYSKNSVRFAKKNDRPYTQPINCPICSGPHYHYQCANYPKNKNAKPASALTMKCLSTNINEESKKTMSKLYIKLLSSPKRQRDKISKEIKYEREQGPLWEKIYNNHYVGIVDKKAKKLINKIQSIKNEKEDWEEICLAFDSIKTYIDDEKIYENRGTWSNRFQRYISKEEQNKKLVSFWIETLERESSLIYDIEDTINPEEFEELECKLNWHEDHCHKDNQEEDWPRSKITNNLLQSKYPGSEEFEIESLEVHLTDITERLRKKASQELHSLRYVYEEWSDKDLKKDDENSYNEEPILYKDCDLFYSGIISPQLYQRHLKNFKKRMDYNYYVDRPFTLIRDWIIVKRLKPGSE